MADQVKAEKDAVRANDHVKVGAGRTVWRVDYLSGRRAYLDNGFTGAHQPYVVDRLTVVGSCEPRSSLRERPDRCETCGNYREVGPRTNPPASAAVEGATELDRNSGEGNGRA